MALLVSLILPLAFWILFCLVLGADAYAMDQGYHKGSFFPLLTLYSIFGYVVFFAAMGMAFFQFRSGMVWTPSVMAIAAVHALLFNLLLLVFYESYLHAQAVQPERSNYARWKYAAVIALGLSALITFGMGLAMTAISAAADKVL